jgi:hypothetical protein
MAETFEEFAHRVHHFIGVVDIHGGNDVSHCGVFWRGPNGE